MQKNPEVNNIGKNAMGTNQKKFNLKQLQNYKL